jgi:hypothetical protein
MFKFPANRRRDKIHSSLVSLASLFVNVAASPVVLDSIGKATINAVLHRSSSSFGAVQGVDLL